MPLIGRSNVLLACGCALVPARVALEMAVEDAAATAAVAAMVATVALAVAVVEVEPRQAGVPRRCHEFACRTRSTGEEAYCNPRSGKYSVGCSTPAPL